MDSRAFGHGAGRDRLITGLSAKVRICKLDLRMYHCDFRGRVASPLQVRPSNLPTLSR